MLDCFEMGPWGAPPAPNKWPLTKCVHKSKTVWSNFSKLRRFLIQVLKSPKCLCPDQQGRTVWRGQVGTAQIWTWMNECLSDGHKTGALSLCTVNFMLAWTLKSARVASFCWLSSSFSLSTSDAGGKQTSQVLRSCLQMFYHQSNSQREDRLKTWQCFSCREMTISEHIRTNTERISSIQHDIWHHQHANLPTPTIPTLHSDTHIMITSAQMSCHSVFHYDAVFWGITAPAPQQITINNTETPPHICSLPRHRRPQLTGTDTQHEFSLFRHI